MAKTFELRAYLFIDSLQPQLAQYIAKANQVYDPAEYDAVVMVELHPAMEIHSMVDLALKATKVRLGSVVTERHYGMMQVQHPEQAEVLAAGQSVLDATDLSLRDRAKVEILTNKIIRGVEQDHAISFTGLAWGDMVTAGDSVLIMEVAPAAYLQLACNEALKAATVRLVTIAPAGATGRLILAGSESMIDTAADAAVASLHQLNAETEAG
jgi:ethanolamine utilization microcompartment shell protein EutS